jgi:glyoxalase family protein
MSSTIEHHPDTAELTQSPATAIRQHHHITLCVGDAQEDYDFHTKILGLKSVKKTALYDGTVPIYHLYYGNEIGLESTLVTSFPMRQSGRKARPGTGQIKTLALSVPQSSLDYWEQRLTAHAFAVRRHERFGEDVLTFAHPCGIRYELVGVTDDARLPYSNGDVPSQYAIRGTHGITVSIRELESSAEFMSAGWGARESATEGRFRRYEVGTGGTGRIIDLEVEPDVAQGTWTFGEGAVHHCAFQVDNHDVQSNVKGYLEGLGYTDVSDRKDRGYFDSVYVRTPGGALFEATVSKPDGFAVDEPIGMLGQQFQVPPVFAKQREWIMNYLEPLKY